MSTQHFMIPEEDQTASVPPQARPLYVTLAQYSAEWNSSLHTHTCSELFFITGGRGRVQVQSESFPVAVNDLVVVNTGVPHAETSQTDAPLEYIVLGVEGLETFSSSGGYALLHLRAGWDELLFCQRMIFQEAREARPGFAGVCQRLLDVILLRLMRQEGFALSQGQPGRRSSRECDLVRRYIDNHFKENLSLDQLAAIAHINKYYLVHAFRKEFNTSPINYLISRRIQESRFLLSETDHTLSQIAQILGFSSLSYFSQSFRRLEGVSPKEYRKRHRR